MPLSRRPARDLTGLHIAITGGARGIGAATAERLVRAGAQVVIGDRDVELAAETAARLGCKAAALDVSDTASWARFVSDAGPLDVLINNAGIMPLARILDESEETQRAVFNVNVHGPINGVKAVAPSMVEQGRGHIVNVSSAVGRVPARGGSTYSASKHAIVGFTDAIRLELEPLGVNISMVLPTVIRTELAAGLADNPGMAPQGPEDVAEVIEDVLRKPVPEAWVPRWAQAPSRITGMLPRKVQDLIMEKSGGHVLDSYDPADRAAYEDRARS